jgi:putative NIF3 family GTP cyclohydrolase 1 type 2
VDLSAPSLAALAATIERITHTELFTGQPPSIFASSAREVRRLGLALEPTAAVMERVRDEKLDALFLHRPWTLSAAGIGVLASHLPFDERLTIGFNPDLAEALGIADIEVLGTKEGRSLGMVGDFDEGSFERLIERITAEFGAPEAIQPGRAAIRRVAAVGAMTDALVREAAERGADVYVTGQMRVPARAAVEETGIAVVAIGHRRSEVWGLHLLARLLRDGWPELHTLVLDTP